MKAFSALLFCLAALPLDATDIVTVKGRQYREVHDVMIRGEEVSFSTDTEIVKLKITDLPPATREFYQTRQNARPVPVSAPAEATPLPTPVANPALQAQIDRFKGAVVNGMKATRLNRPVTLAAGDAFPLADLEKAKAKAAREGKLLGFIMIWGDFLGPEKRPQEQGSGHGLAHFHGVFKDALILVFVRHENELNSVPDAVKKGFFGPEEGGFAPNMAVTDASAKDFICEIPYGGDKSNGPIREQLFLHGAEQMVGYMIAKSEGQAP